MARLDNRLRRHRGTRRYKKMFVIATEGEKTEPHYFSLLQNRSVTIHIKCLTEKGTNSPYQVLKRMEDFLRKNHLEKNDEAWLVVDKDSWTDEQLRQLHDWTKNKPNQHFLALSNPKFEYWLLLHFENGVKISSSRQCSERLKKYLPDYDKGLDNDEIVKLIPNAIKRAKRKDTPPCKTWPQTTGTTIYRLVEKIVSADKND